MVSRSQKRISSYLLLSVCSLPGAAADIHTHIYQCWLLQWPRGPRSRSICLYLRLTGGAVLERTPANVLMMTPCGIDREVRGRGDMTWLLFVYTHRNQTTDQTDPRQKSKIILEVKFVLFDVDWKESTKGSGRKTMSTRA